MDSNPLKSGSAPNPGEAFEVIRRRHLAVCWRWQLDTGNGCICRPPACREPLHPTAEELELAIRGWS